MKPTSFLLCAALVIAAAPGASAQGFLEPSAAPTCAEQGIARVAVSVPPGKTEEEIRQALASNSPFPAGVDVRVLERVEHPRLTNFPEFKPRLERMLQALLRRGQDIEGTGSTLLELDEDGRVTTVHPASGSRAVDQHLDRLWRFAEFTPVVVEGCRARAWVHMRASFKTEDEGDRDRMEVQVGP
ncbi:MAG: hypothetical protein AVDCRST_MAG89-4756 [uncultured Gemmatimonadetes bacterium]|uniref:TonB C-terminal domain-containing protein n=1 Tax=uncultured Gemmatimonadota bacterium TaxID=203437 RepID=A0A6J4MZD7_9BACT|nr:MAG: hypothetical protein AVDCRST_MAG89-4756 [uncultured Gemmatimonadota bacterium]